MTNTIIKHIREIFPQKGPIALHEPVIGGAEKKHVLEALDSGFVSTFGPNVAAFEKQLGDYIGADHVVAVASGTAALHTCLLVAGVGVDDEVITQSLTFVATGNAISYTGAHPVFLDVEASSLGLCPKELSAFLEQNATRQPTGCLNKQTGRTLKAVLPMHTFGHACKIQDLKAICEAWGLLLIEDAAEAMGSRQGGKHLGTVGDIAAFSFNGNKILTSGSGGAVVTNNAAFAARARHLSTTAKVAHPWAFMHDEIGYNYRMTNLNAALGLAQLGQLDAFLVAKRKVAHSYKAFFKNRPEQFIEEPDGAQSNYWLNSILFPTEPERTAFLDLANKQGVQVRPIWEPLHRLPMFSACMTGPMDTTNDIAGRVMNLPSSAVGGLGI
ncbi:MAG: LegC family aminotransferase [Kordiimonadaceae bacterium]|nr:LegC family aminotransferase [Kordiimonadaceae bacterium]